jgi:hypothetical protein
MFWRPVVLCLLNYVLTPSVAPIVQLNCSVMNNEIERICKEAVVA